MAKAFGIVNTSGNHIWVEGMQDYRPIGAFSFLGRYRITDFPISNMSNSDIDRIQVFAGSNPKLQLIISLVYAESQFYLLRANPKTISTTQILLHFGQT